MTYHSLGEFQLTYVCEEPALDLAEKEVYRTLYTSGRVDGLSDDVIATLSTIIVVQNKDKFHPGARFVLNEKHLDDAVQHIEEELNKLK